jgi:anaerobic magnesium-protoporphyrin IX monomethyl ester cyclase
MDRISKYRDTPSARLFGEISTLGVLAHETGHRWLVRLRFLDADRAVSDQLLGRQLAHWSFFADTDGSVMEGNEIEDLGGGAFRTASATEKYSRLDLYAMGLATEAEVPRWFYIEAPSSNSSREAPPMVGVTINGTRRDVLIQDVIDAPAPAGVCLRAERDRGAGSAGFCTPGPHPGAVRPVLQPRHRKSHDRAHDPSAMNILLLSMPDAFEHTPAIAIRMPNGALASLAGNVDPHHQVAIADLVLAQSSVRQAVKDLMDRLKPDLVGLSVMTFQRVTARRLIAFIRSLKPDVRIVVGGYDPSLAPDEWTDPALGVDAIVRGEGDVTFRELVRACEQQQPLAAIAGLWFRDGDVIRKNPPRAVSSLDRGEIRPPKRSARVLSGYTMMGRQADVVETSRGCTFDCSFCSIIEMRGRNFHRFPLERVIDDIADARAGGARSIFLVDDNITLDVERFEALCEAIIQAGLNRIDYLVQGMTAPIAARGETLAPLMRRAGFRYVFLGIENVLDDDLVFLKARAKNSRLRSDGRVNTALAAVNVLRRHGLIVVGGLIVGNPDDRRESVAANLEFAKRYIDWPYIQHPTPYPGTPMTREFESRGLVVNTRPEEYDGTTAVTRSAHLDPEEIEFMRWRAERWMKVRHMPAAFRHDPLFVLKNGRRMLAHTFRGTTWRSAVGLEAARDVFRRYRGIRQRERQYIDWPDPTERAGV